MNESHMFREYKPMITITKYFEDGTIEEWLSNEEEDLLYLIRHYRHPSGKSPIVVAKEHIDTHNPNTKPGQDK